MEILQNTQKDIGKELIYIEINIIDENSNKNENQ